MKATDLMINDLVQCEGCSTPSVVAGITPGKIHTWWADGTKHAKDEVYFTPIPLTAEILEKNGITPFKQTYEEAVEGITRYGVFGKNKEWGDTIFQYDDCNYFVMDGSCLNYVHQLQHVLRLHMVSDWADNFKI